MRFSSLAALAVLAVAVACAERIQEADDPRVASDAIFVSVENNHSMDMNIYAVTHGDLRLKLGTVTGFAERRFRLPDGLGNAAEFRLLADPIGSMNGLVTGRILVSPGDEVVWRLQEPLRVSSYTLRLARNFR
jgi:hypothetical protein